VNGDTSEQSGRSQTRSFYSWLITFVSFICLPNAFAAYSRLYVFGDSLSDLVNNAVILAPGVTPVPISASSLGLNVHPSLFRGTHYRRSLPSRVGCIPFFRPSLDGQRAQASEPRLP